MSISESFREKGYIYLNNFLDKENCQQYVDEFKKFIEEGKTTVDSQCPLSHSLGHSALFDSLLEQLTPNIETVTGKKLYPTYAYARWYAPGDELKIHQDRPSCEISATITLGFSGSSWPIYMGYDKDKKNCQQINMNVGDAVVYKGQEMYHWREKYTEGEWQAQVFIHYVDANGPNAEWKYDKRNELSHHKEAIIDLPDQNFLVKKAFTKTQCEHLIKKFDAKDRNFIEANLQGNVINKEIRNSKKIQISVSEGIGATLAGMGLQANFEKWKFNISHCEQSEFLKYDQSGKFVEHLDTILSPEIRNPCRKLTIICFLNDDFEGGQLYLKDQHVKKYPLQEAGTVLVFPSFLLHAVEPVISGIRRTIVTWLVGPPLK